MNRHELTNLATYGDTEGVQQLPIYSRDVSQKPVKRVVMRHNGWSDLWAYSLSQACSMLRVNVLKPIPDEVWALRRKLYKENTRLAHQGCRTSTKRNACGGACKVYTEVR